MFTVVTSGHALNLIVNFTTQMDRVYNSNLRQTVLNNYKLGTVDFCASVPNADRYDRFR